jgi:AcrR family transcriptional regulator
MPQIVKPELRDAIVGAAAAELARAGYEGMTLAIVAASAGTSTSNLYKYFASKEELFAATVPPELVREIQALFRRRIEALGNSIDPSALPGDHPYQTVSGELLELAIERRHELLFLLRHARATAYTSFSDELVGSLTKLAISYAERVFATANFTASNRRTLLRLYRAFLASIASILEEETTRRGLQEAVAQLATYHLAGLRAFFESVAIHGEEGR